MLRGFRGSLILTGALLLVALNAVGAWPRRDSWWGFHLYGFLPAGAFFVAAFLVLVVVALTLLAPLRSPPSRGSPAPSPGRASPPDDAMAGRSPRPFLARAGPPLLLSAGFLCLTILFRVRHLLLGDGIPLVQNLAAGLSFHPREPLTYWVQSRLFHLFVALFPAAGDQATAARAVAAGSVLAGFIFAGIAWGLSGEILEAWRNPRKGAFTPNPSDGPAAMQRGPVAERILITMLLLSQGYALLFFGYVENYAYLLCAAALFLFSGLRAARGAGPVWVPGVAAVLATAFHISGALLFPAWLVLVATSFPRARLWTAIEVACVGLVMGATWIVMGLLHRGYDWIDAILVVGRVTTTSGVGGINRSYLGSAAHFRDFLNEHALLGPLALFLMIPVLIRFALGRRRLRAGELFLGINGLLWLLVVTRIADSNLGYARDWDLQATAALGFTVAGLYLLGDSRPDHRSEARFLSGALALSLFTFVPWVVVNASAERSVQRAASLPLGHGRSEVLVGTWYLREHRFKEAEEWYRRALRVDVQSHPGWCGLACVAFQQEDYARAARLFGVTVKLRPDLVMYRQSLVSALIHDQKYEEASGQFAELLAIDKRNVLSWLQYGQLLCELGRTAEARQAFLTVLALDPEHPEALKRLGEIDHPPLPAEFVDPPVILNSDWPQAAH